MEQHGNMPKSKQKIVRKKEENVALTSTEKSVEEELRKKLWIRLTSKWFWKKVLIIIGAITTMISTGQAFLESLNSFINSINTLIDSFSCLFVN